MAVRSAPSHPPTSAVGGKVPAKSARPMRGLVEEAQHEISQQDTKRPIMDLVIVAGMQRIEHHEIAAYGTDIALARALGEREVVDLLIIDAGGGEANGQPAYRSAEQHIMPAALASDETAEKEPSDRNKASGGRAKAA